MKIQPNGVQQEQPQSSVRKGGWREKLLYSRREIEDSSFLAAEEELTSKNPIVPPKFQGDKLLLRFSIISIQSPRIPSISNYASEASYEHFNSVFILSVSLILYEILLKAKSKHCPSFVIILKKVKLIHVRHFFSKKNWAQLASLLDII